MINLYALDKYRLRGPDVIKAFGSEGSDKFGIFEIPSCSDSYVLRVIASVGDGWDHVSVSRRTRCPSWEEMEFIKRLFFRKDETAMQLHVPAADHINCHPFCLHLWRPLGRDIPRPPSWMVGPSSERTTA